MRYDGPTRYVIRDFSTATGEGVAYVHIVENRFGFHSCTKLENYTVHDEAGERGRGDGVDLSACEFEYKAATVEEAEAAHRAQFTADFPIRRHECVDRHQEWLAGLVTLPQLATELGLGVDDMDDLWGRLFDDCVDLDRMFATHRLVDPQHAAGDPPADH
jgi:hypothetical protein